MTEKAISWPQRLKPHRKWFLVLGLAVTVYAGVGILGGPPLVRYVIARGVDHATNLELKLGEISVNPFTLSATVRSLKLSTPDDAPVLSWRRLHANLQLSSILRWALVLKNLELDGLHAHVRVGAQGQFELLDTIKPELLSSSKSTSEPRALPRLVVKRFHLTDAAISTKIATVKPAWTHNMRVVSLDLQDLSTLPDEKGVVTLRVTTPREEHLSAEATFGLNPVEVRGSVAIIGLQLDHATPFLPDGSVTTIKSGTLAFNTEYSASFDEMGVRLELGPGNVAANDVTLVDGWEQQEDLRYRSRPVSLDIALKRLAVSFLSEQQGLPGHVSLALTQPPTGTFGVEGAFGIAPPMFHGSAAIADWDVTPASALVEQFAAISLQKGLLAGGADVRIELGEAEPTLSVGASGGIQDLVVLEQSTGKPWLSVAHARAEQLSLSTRERQLSVDTVNVEAPAVSVRVDPKGQSSLEEMVAERHGMEKVQKLLAGYLDVLNEYQASAELIRIADAHVRFRDRSVSPTFSGELTQGNVSIRGLNPTGTPGNIKVSGTINREARVLARGPFRLTGAKPFLRLKARLMGLPLPAFSPYAGRFAGYAIDKGTLSTRSKIRVGKKMARTTTDVEVDDLQLGDEIKSPDALNVPVKLGVALLKDSDGLIRLEVPADAELSNLRISMGRSIRSVVAQSITKAASAPFSMLARLVDSEDKDVSRVRFEPGSTTLAPGERKKLHDLATAIAQRPEIRLEVQGKSSAQADQETPDAQLSENALATLAQDRASLIRDLLLKDGTLKPKQVAMVETDPDAEGTTGFVPSELRIRAAD